MLWQVAWLSATGWVLLLLVELYYWVGIAGSAGTLLLLWVGGYCWWRTTAAAIAAVVHNC